MTKEELSEELDSDEYKNELNRLYTLKDSIIECLLFCYMNSIRDGISQERNFFLRMIDDIYQSVVSINIIAKEGITNICLRELRYLIEVAIKSCLIFRNSQKETFKEQIEEYEKLLNSSNINPLNTLNFGYLGTSNEEFKTDVKKLYGHLSKYTHSSSHQLLERLSRSDSGRTIGYEGIEELKKINDNIEKVYAIVIVMIFHSVAQYVPGDFLVENNGRTIDWYFNRSKYISLIDEKFDYKYERQTILDELKLERKNRIKF
jgi:hypothetical protein